MAKKIPEKPDVFANIMIAYTIVWPIVAAAMLSMAMRAAFPLLRQFWYDINMFFGLCVFEFLPALFSGMYLARRAAKGMEIHRAQYYRYALIGALILPIVIFDALRIMHRTNSYNTPYGSLGFAASFGLVSLVMVVLACICSTLFLAIAERWLEGTPFALKFQKRPSHPTGS